MKKHRKFLKDLQTSEQFYNDQESRQIIGELIAMIDEGYNLQPKTDWIPCEERLPENDEDVLVQMEDDSMMVDFRAASSSGWFWADNDDLPIAWQPLPAPYKKGGAEDEL